MAPELIEDAKADPRNAQFLALASELAYLPAEEGAQVFRSQLGMEARLLSVGNTQAYIASSDEHIVVAFRGTESPTSIDGLKDWLLSDAVNLLILPQGDLGTDYVAAGVGARFHQGFMKALADIWDPLFEAIEAERKKNDRPLWITGHSLGGALAVLAAWRLKRKFIPVHQIYTFGGPMVGNDVAAKAIDQEFAGKIFRYVNLPDPIPKLPSVSLIANHYTHCESEVSLGASADSAAEFFKQASTKSADGSLSASLIEDLWAGLQQRVNAHFMANYRKLIGELRKDS
jgi:triacylglycerol lipase